MVAAPSTLQLNVLHVLTLNGRNGEYGGPVRVARELCVELNSRGHNTHIFSGALKGAEPNSRLGVSESFVLVEPIFKKFPTSTLWSWHLIIPLARQIKKADLVHIHFARDLVSFLAVLLSILNGKTFITQTHGMIILDGRLSTRITDFFFTRKLISKSRVNLVLTEMELAAIRELGVKCPCSILQNGITVRTNLKEKEKVNNRIAFCSRLEKRKRVQKFIELADFFRNAGIKFEIYGPDGGELQLVKSEIINRNLNNILEYKGTLQTDEVQDVLAKVDLLVLPSEHEPFPMVILEALAVGTPVLVMPSCGFAERLKKFESNYVASSENLSGLISSLSSQKNIFYQNKKLAEITNFCAKEFGIEKVVNELLDLYEKALSYDN